MLPLGPLFDSFLSVCLVYILLFLSLAIKVGKHKSGFGLHRRVRIAYQSFQKKTVSLFFISLFVELWGLVFESDFRVVFTSLFTSNVSAFVSENTIFI